MSTSEEKTLYTRICQRMETSEPTDIKKGEVVFKTNSDESLNMFVGKDSERNKHEIGLLNASEAVKGKMLLSDDRLFIANNYMHLKKDLMMYNAELTIHEDSVTDSTGNYTSPAYPRIYFNNNGGPLASIGAKDEHSNGGSQIIFSNIEGRFTNGRSIENFRLPENTNYDEIEQEYDILTTKKTITVTQGGTGESTPEGARKSLQAACINGDTFKGSIAVQGNNWQSYSFRDTKNNTRSAITADADSNKRFFGNIVFDQYAFDPNGNAIKTDSSVQCKDRYLLPQPSNTQKDYNIDGQRWFNILTTNDVLKSQKLLGSSLHIRAGRTQDMYSSSRDPKPNYALEVSDNKDTSNNQYLVTEFNKEYSFHKIFDIDLQTWGSYSIDMTIDSGNMVNFYDNVTPTKITLSIIVRDKAENDSADPDTTKGVGKPRVFIHAGSYAKLLNCLYLVCPKQPIDGAKATLYFSATERLALVNVTINSISSRDTSNDELSGFRRINIANTNERFDVTSMFKLLDTKTYNIYSLGTGDTDTSKNWVALPCYVYHNQLPVVTGQLNAGKTNARDGVSEFKLRKGCLYYGRVIVDKNYFAVPPFSVDVWQWDSKRELMVLGATGGYTYALALVSDSSGEDPFDSTKELYNIRVAKRNVSAAPDGDWENVKGEYEIALSYIQTTSPIFRDVYGTHNIVDIKTS